MVTPQRAELDSRVAALQDAFDAECHDAAGRLAAAVADVRDLRRAGADQQSRIVCHAVSRGTLLTILRFAKLTGQDALEAQLSDPCTAAPCTAAPDGAQGAGSPQKDGDGISHSNAEGSREVCEWRCT